MNGSTKNGSSGRKTLGLSILMAGALLCGQCGGDLGRGGTPPDAAAGAEASRNEVRPQVVARSKSSGLQPVHLSPLFRQSLTYGATYDYSDPSKLYLFEQTRASEQEAWQECSYEYAASFHIKGVSSRAKNDFLILGLTEKSESVVERWRRSSSSSGSAPGGGAAPGSALPQPLMRKGLYRGTILGEVRHVGADPLGRYAVLIHGSPTRLTWMPLPTGTPLQQIVDATELPNLERVTGLYPRDHISEGRLWILETFGNSDPTDLECPRSVVYDFDDNAVLDAWLTMDQDTWEGMGYTGAVWGEDFICHDMH